MTIKEAIISVLEDNKGTHTYRKVLQLINAQNYIDWGNAKTPSDTIGALLGDFIRQNDTRIKRIKGKKGFEYYFAKYENELNLTTITAKEPTAKASAKMYQERDLHLLLSSYLKNENIYSKTIFHEKSLNKKDDHQKWVHPDMIGIDFLKLNNKASHTLMNVVNKAQAFNLISYELKREIKTDYELKKCFFQAVSNSSWANYGYLVAFEISKNLMDEMERLSQSFGIGIIELAANPYKSKVLFHADYKELDFKTIDKLCEINKDFEKFISPIESLLGAQDKNSNFIQIGFEEFCDSYLKTDSEIKKYCLSKNIPYEESELEE